MSINAFGALRPTSGDLIVGFRDPSKDPDDPQCCSLIHDRPRVMVKLAVDEEDWDFDEEDAREEEVDLREKPVEFFHRKGICPCEGGYRGDGRRRKPRLVSWSQRQKQVVRACRGDSQLWLMSPRERRSDPAKRAPGRPKAVK